MAGSSGWSADETAADLFGRLAQDPLRLPCLPCGLYAGEALEVFGEPGTGKTALLMECILTIRERPCGRPRRNAD